MANHPELAKQVRKGTIHLQVWYVLNIGITGENKTLIRLRFKELTLTPVDFR